MFLCSSLTAFTSFSSPCSESGFVAYFSPQRVATCNFISTSLMSHLLVCSHNLSPAPSASRSGTWFTILVHLAAGRITVVYVVMERHRSSSPSSTPAPRLTISQRVSWVRSSREGLFWNHLEKVDLNSFDPRPVFLAMWLECVNSCFLKSNSRRMRHLTHLLRKFVDSACHRHAVAKLNSNNFNALEWTLWKCKFCNSK